MYQSGDGQSYQSGDGSPIDKRILLWYYYLGDEICRDRREKRVI